MDAHIQFAPIATLKRLNDPAWNRADRTLYDSGSLGFLLGKNRIPLLIDHDKPPGGRRQHALPDRGAGLAALDMSEGERGRARWVWSEPFALSPGALAEQDATKLLKASQAVRLILGVRSPQLADVR
jgi:hypothetical protein